MRNPIPQGKRQFWGENVASHCKVMGHSTVRCAKTAEPIDMLFWMKTLVGPRIHAVYRGCRFPRRWNNFRGLFGPFKSIGHLRCTGLGRVAAKWVIQSPRSAPEGIIQYARQTQIVGYFWAQAMRLSVAKRAMGLQSAGEVWYLWLPCSWWFQCGCVASKYSFFQ